MRLDPRPWLVSIRPDRRTLKRDLVAGVPGAIASVPDGMASAVLAGVNPVHGLYASFAGPTAGGLTASTRLMVITTTTAAALAAGSALEGLNPADRPAGLFVLTLVAGVAMIAAGVAQLGRYTRFVSLSVMIGFLTGVAANIVLGQLPDLVGVDADGDVALAKALDVITHPGSIQVASLLVGVSALVILVLVSRTRAGVFASIVALVLPTLVALRFDNVAQVDDVGEIPTGVPLPHLPDLSLLLSFEIWTGGLAVAAIVLVQGVGVAESAPNLDGTRSNTNLDFVAQGAGNVASSLFRGQPVGGSVGQTALNVSAGAQSRWASIFSGLWMLAILVAFAGLVGNVAMPTLAAILIFAAVGSLRIGQIKTIMRTGAVSQIAIVTTFLATLFLPIPAAVGIGVAISLLLQLNREALDLSVVELVVRPDGALEEREAPALLESDRVTVLDVYGSLFYAGAKTLDVRLPEPAGATRAVVVLRLRGRTTMGATAFGVLAAYAARLHALGGRLYLSGVDPALLGQLERRGDLPDGLVAMPMSAVVGESSLQAFHDATAWLASQERP